MGRACLCNSSPPYFPAHLSQRHYCLSGALPLGLHCLLALLSPHIASPTLCVNLAVFSRHGPSFNFFFSFHHCLPLPSPSRWTPILHIIYPQPSPSLLALCSLSLGSLGSCTMSILCSLQICFYSVQGYKISLCHIPFLSWASGMVARLADMPFSSLKQDSVPRKPTL